MSSSDWPSVAWHGRDRAALTALLGVWAVVLTGVALGPTRLVPLGATYPPSDRVQVESAREKIDPNTAPTASLCRLPLIGPARASALVAYRQQHAAGVSTADPKRDVSRLGTPGSGPAGGRAFQFTEDLEKVYRIGPGTVERARPFLALPSRVAPAAASAPAQEKSESRNPKSETNSKPK